MDPLDENSNTHKKQDTPSIGWSILAFLIPISGVIMYFNNKKEFPVKAKRYIQLAGFGMALGAVLRIIGA